MDKNKILELRARGKTYQEIATIKGVTKQRIHQLLTGYIPKNKGANDKRYRQTHKEKSNAYMRDYLQGPGREKHKALKQRENEKLKILVLTHYGGGKCACIACGFCDIRALSIDHVNGEGNLHKAFTYRWLIKNQYPEGYQTLCMNCQWIKRVENKEVQRTDLKNIL